VIVGHNQYAAGHARHIAMDGPLKIRRVFP
jgi:hypothetical protein